MANKRQRNETEEKDDKTYQPGQEDSPDETSEEEEEEESQSQETNESEDDFLREAQSVIRDAKKSSKKKVSGKDSSMKSKKKKELKRKMTEPEVDEVDEEDDERKLKKPKTDGGAKKKSASLFNDKNVDVNLYNEAPQNIIEKIVKINQGLLMKCHVVDASEMKGNYNNSDFSALTFVKRIKDGKAFNFSIPLNLGPVIQDAIQVFVSSNPRFFSGSKTYELSEVIRK